jgi:hypothetical protein
MISKFNSLSLRTQAQVITAGIMLLVVLLVVAAVKFPLAAMLLICFTMIALPLSQVVMAVIITVYNIVYRKIENRRHAKS